MDSVEGPATCSSSGTQQMSNETLIFFEYEDSLLFCFRFLVLDFEFIGIDLVFGGDISRFSVSAEDKQASSLRA